MARSRAFLLPALACICGLWAPLLMGCGDDDAPVAKESGPAWSDHAPTDVTPEAAGSPDGDTPLVQSAERLLKALHDRIEQGRGMADVGYERDVRAVASVLWPPDGDAEQMTAAQAHMRVAAIAAQVSGWLRESEDARAERTQSHPLDVKIHDAFLAASALAPQAYAAWCGERGVSLLRELEAARREKFFGKR